MKDNSGASLAFQLVLFYFLGIFLFLCNGIAINIAALSWLVGQILLFTFLVSMVIAIVQKAMEK